MDLNPPEQQQQQSHHREHYNLFSNQKFELVRDRQFASDDDVYSYVREKSLPLGSNMRSQLMQCSHCRSNQDQHKMQVRYFSCVKQHETNDETCRNDLPCYKTTRCLKSPSCRLYRSNRHCLPGIAPRSRSQSRRRSTLKGINHPQPQVCVHNESAQFVVPPNPVYDLNNNINTRTSPPPLNSCAADINDQISREENISMNASELVSFNPDDLAVLENNLFEDLNFGCINLNENDNKNRQENSVSPVLVEDEKEEVEEEENRRTIWKTGIVLVYKANVGSNWFEYNMADDEITHTYKELSRKNDEVVLFDIERKFYIKPTSLYIFCGSSETSVDKRFNDGNWIEWTAWKERGREVYFKRVDESSWEKWVDGVRESDGSYDVMRIEGDVVVLRKMNCYFKLSWRDLCTSKSMNNWKKLTDGTYSSLNFIQL